MNKLLELHQRYSVSVETRCECCGNETDDEIDVYAKSRKEAEKLALKEVEGSDPWVTGVEEIPPKLYQITLTFMRGKKFSTSILGYWDNLSLNKEEIGAYLAHSLFPNREFKSVELSDAEG